MSATPDVHQHGIASWAARRLRHDLANWRLFLVRIVTSGLAVVLTVVLLPGLRFATWGWGEFLVLGLVFGLLNATLKPLLQFFSLRYLIASYGLVVVLINAVLLGLLSWILGGALLASSALSYLVGGLLIGIVSMLLDALAGTTPPILDRPLPAAGPAAVDEIPTFAQVVLTGGAAVQAAEEVDLDVLADAAAVLAGTATAAEPPEVVPPKAEPPEAMPLKVEPPPPEPPLDRTDRSPDEAEGAP